jgi:hypothetical protein
MTVTSNEFETILEDLGSSPEAIAERMAFLGIQGVRNAARILNPLIRYFQGMAKSHWLTMDVMKPGVLRIVSTDGEMEILLPTAVQEFLGDFNQGRFPELEQGRTSSRR